MKMLVCTTKDSKKKREKDEDVLWFMERRKTLLR